MPINYLEVLGHTPSIGPGPATGFPLPPNIGDDAFFDGFTSMPPTLTTASYRGKVLYQTPVWHQEYSGLKIEKALVMDRRELSKLPKIHTRPLPM